MIPQRRHRDLPDHLAWIITEQRIPNENRRQLIVYLASDIPRDSPLEQVFVRQAFRAWRRDHRGLVLLPAPIAGGGGLGWLLEQLRRPAVAASTAVAAAGVAFAAVTVVETPGHAPHRPPAAAAPPASPRVSRPPQPAPKPVPSRPSVPKPAPKTHPAAADPDGGVVEPVVERATVPRVRVRVPPVHVKVPPVQVTPPPVKTPPPPVSATSCRLVRVEVGRLVRVCL